MRTLIAWVSQWSDRGSGRKKKERDQDRVKDREMGQIDGSSNREQTERGHISLSVSYAPLRKRKRHKKKGKRKERKEKREKIDSKKNESIVKKEVMVEDVLTKSNCSRRIAKSQCRHLGHLL